MNIISSYFPSSNAQGRYSLLAICNEIKALAHETHERICELLAATYAEHYLEVVIEGQVMNVHAAAGATKEAVPIECAIDTYHVRLWSETILSGCHHLDDGENIGLAQPHGQPGKHLIDILVRVPHQKKTDLHLLEDAIVH